MAYTNSPENQTYKTVKIKFDGTPNYRSGDLALRDINIVNFYYDRVTQENKTREVALKKRPGLKETGYSLSKVTNTDAVRGYFYDTDQNALYWSIGNKVYAIKPDTTGNTVRTVTTLATNSGYVGFCTYLKSDNTRYVVFSDGTELWLDQYDIITCNKVTDADMPSPHLPYPVYLDGYIFLAKTLTGDIYNSNVDDPFTWTAGDLISAEMGSDYIIRLTKNKNYLIAFGHSTIEYFWDAAEASGSPMNRNESPFKNIGYVTGFAQQAEKVYFVGRSENLRSEVYELDGFKITKISNVVVDRSIETFSNADNNKDSVNLNKDGFILSVDGHVFYVLVLTTTTWVYDTEEKFWYEWKGADDVGLNIEAVWPMYNAGQYLAIKNKSYMSQINQSIYTDFNSSFACQYTTERFDAGTQNNKFCHRLTVKTDKHNGVSGTSNLQLYWSDDDWVTTLGPRNINLSQDLSCTRQLGRFRNRSFRLHYRDPYPLRITELEMDINVGNI